MQKGLISVLVVGVLVIGGYFVLRGTSPEDQAANVSDTVENVENNEATMPEAEKKISFSEFIKQDGTYKCMVTQNIEGTSTEGTVYINKGMVRGEFKTEVKGMNVDSNMIVRDGYTYAWSSAAPTMGFKAKVMMDSTSTDASASGSYSWNADQIGDYNCEVRTLDESKFVLPKGVTFKEMTAASMMPKDAMMKTEGSTTTQ